MTELSFPPISIHALLAESDVPVQVGEAVVVKISIHALLAESDAVVDTVPLAKPKFQSTLSLRRATQSSPAWSLPTRNFNPRSPCGERHHHRRPPMQVRANFNPRSPCGERPVTWMKSPRRPMISIHALLAESDHNGRCVYPYGCDFNPRSPCGERRGRGGASPKTQINFNPRSPCGERPARRRLLPHVWQISIHALLAESDALAPSLRVTWA